MAGPAGQLITDETLPAALVDAPRVTTLGWHAAAASDLAAVTDGRGATPLQIAYDGAGRVNFLTINGNVETIEYLPLGLPAALAPLDPGNRVVRVIDREGNIADFEIHGLAGGPLGGKGIAGLRRLVQWTERGKGNPPLRTSEPDYYETRILHDCDCLKEAVATDPFANTTPGLAFDANQIPTNYPRAIYTHNAFRQVLQLVATDGTESITIRNTYQPNAFGDSNEYSRVTTITDPREFDSNPIYAGADIVHRYEYDARGNTISHRSPQATLGQAAPQLIVESWDYNQFGQQVSHTDPNGNITRTEYHSGSSVGGDVNTPGTFGGYPSAVVSGAPGSADSAPALRVSFRVNAFGMPTEITDGRGFVSHRTFNDLKELVGVAQPPVTLGNGMIVQYESRSLFDAAGNPVLRRRNNIDADGTLAPDPWIDRSASFDAIGNVLAQRVEVDGNPANDLVSEMAYDRNDRLIVVQLPKGNRKFHVYDERNLPFRTFYGIEAGPGVTASYPPSKLATTLGGAGFVGLTTYSYDSRANQVQIVDGRGNSFDAHYDFLSRLVATSDQNGNGTIIEYDDASNGLTIRAGEVDKATGIPVTIEAVSYRRYDEVGRLYQTVHDIDLGTDESAALDPDDGANSSFRRQFDAAGRIIGTTDANGNTTSARFDGANRLVRRRDALGNLADLEYDQNSNLVRVSELETAGPGATGADESYVTTVVWDELNRARETHELGLNGNSFDHVAVRHYDSRNNLRVVVDPEGTATVHTYDALNRNLVRQVFDSDPLAGGATELERTAVRYDANSNVVARIAIGDLANPGATQQVTRTAFDELDRAIREIKPDSDDPVDGSNHGPDGIFDRQEVIYDENSNAVRFVDQRGVVSNRQFDPGNRMTALQLALPGGIPGETRRTFQYDHVNRPVVARNDYAEITTEYDSLSRTVAETQAIRLDGQGFLAGYQFPIRVEHGYDKQSNLVECAVLDGPATDLHVQCGRDALHRTDSISAAYFGSGMHSIAAYSFFGRGRVQTCRLGNGVVHARSYDTKRRVSVCEWKDPGNNLLAGFEYGYDRMNNALFESVLHDGGRFDHYQYDRRYQLTGVEYRSASPAPPAVPANQFLFDSNYSRVAAVFSGPMGGPPTSDQYQKNLANEFTGILRNGNPANGPV